MYIVENGLGKYDFRCTVVAGLVIDEFLLIGSDGFVKIIFVLNSVAVLKLFWWS